MASVALVPRAEQDIRAALNVLALNFSLNDKVVEELLKVGVRNLEEFRFLFEDEAKVGASVAKIGLGDVEQDRSKVALADLDSLLEESELRDAKKAFWRRYRLRFPAEVHPSDAVVSRVSRELSKRMLCLFNVWKVRSLQFQLGTSQKKRRLGDGLFTEEAETEESYTAACDTYLNKLHTLLIAYSLAGCQPLSGVADAAKEQTLGADSTEYVEVKERMASRDAYWLPRVVAETIRWLCQPPPHMQQWRPPSPRQNPSSCRARSLMASPRRSRCGTDCDSVKDSTKAPAPTRIAAMERIAVR